jgi:hypothetical protein
MTGSTITLSDGREAVLRPGKGRDLLAAQRKIRDPSELIFALCAELVTVGSAPLLYEDLLEMPVADVLALQGAVAGNFPLPSPTPAA